MNFVAARCPQCGGDLQLDKEKETGFCMHCGSKIIVQDAIRAVRIDNSHMIATWMKMGKAAAESNNYEEAYKYFTKVVEIDLENWNALFLKGQAAGFLSTLSNPRLDELIGGINAANEIVDKSKMQLEKSVKIKNMFAMAIYDLIGAFDELVWNRYFAKDDKFFETDWDLMWDTRSWDEREISYLQKAIALIDQFVDECSIANKTKIKKLIVSDCESICGYTCYYLDFNKEHLRYFGYTAKQKQPYIELADQMIVEIRRVVPDYWSPSDYINRLDTPEFTDSHEKEKLTLEEKKAEKRRCEIEAEFQKQKYWESHPNEYKTFLAEEKRKRDELEKQKDGLKIKIAEKSTQIEEVKRKVDLEIDNLRKEREGLGIFAAKQKKEIDEKINSEEHNLLVLRNELNDLKKRLQIIEV